MLFYMYFYVLLCFADSEKEGELCRLMASQKDQADQAQKALDDFKVQVENSSAQMYEHMKIQVWHAAYLMNLCVADGDLPDFWIRNWSLIAVILLVFFFLWDDPFQKAYISIIWNQIGMKFENCSQINVHRLTE